MRTRLGKTPPAPLEELMGSDIDAIKLVSCMMLFQHVAKTLQVADPQPHFASMADQADIILAAAAESHVRARRP